MQQKLRGRERYFVEGWNYNTQSKNEINKRDIILLLGI